MKEPSIRGGALKECTRSGICIHVLPARNILHQTFGSAPAPSRMYARERAGVRGLGVVALATMCFTPKQDMVTKVTTPRRTPHPNPLPRVLGRGDPFVRGRVLHIVQVGAKSRAVLAPVAVQQMGWIDAAEWRVHPLR